MKTYFDELEDRRSACKTLEDWKSFATWLANELYSRNSNQLAMQEAILNTYGQKELDKLCEMAAEIEENYLPIEMAMHAFGYVNDEMMPIPVERAIHYFEEGREVYLLSSNNTERLATTETDIQKHNGFFGISMPELERIARENPHDMEKD